ARTSTAPTRTSAPPTTWTPSSTPRVCWRASADARAPLRSPSGIARNALSFLTLIDNRMRRAGMREDGHHRAAEETRVARARLVLPDDIRACAELSFGIAFHVAAVGAHRHDGEHRDSHEGLARWLRQRGAHDASVVWEQIERLRVGHWYGGQ